MVSFTNLAQSECPSAVGSNVRPLAIRDRRALGPPPFNAAARFPAICRQRAISDF
jgi:hypothetical protein